MDNILRLRNGSAGTLPCDACFLVQGGELIAQWRGGIYRVGGRDAAALTAGLGLLVTGADGSTGALWDRLFAGLEEASLARSCTDQASDYLRAPSDFEIPGGSVGHAVRIISCMSPAFGSSLASAMGWPSLSVIHRALGFDWLRLAEHLGATGEPVICLLSCLIAGEVADWLVAAGEAPSGLSWAIHWPEALYVFRAGSETSTLLRIAVARAEANADRLPAGLSFLRATAAGAWAPDQTAGPTPQQIRTLLSIMACGEDAARAWRIVPSGCAQDATSHFGRCRSSAPADLRAAVRSRADRLLDRRIGILKFAYEYGRLRTPAEEMFVWRAGFGNPRHTLGCNEKFDPCMDAFSADPDAGMARLKAMMEALERYSGMRWPAGEWRKAKRGELDGLVLEFEDLPRYSFGQYLTPGFEYAPFSAEEPKTWLRGRSLITGEMTWVLSDFVVWPAIEARPCVQATSSGTAAHISWESACVSALYELIERDALVMVWLKRLACPRIAAEALPRRLEEWIAGINIAGYRVHLLDATTDFGVPVAMVLGEAVESGRPHLLVHGGAGPTLVTAIEKGLKELAMMIVYLGQRGYESVMPSQPVSEYRHPCDHARMYYTAAARPRWQFLIESDAETSPNSPPNAPPDPAGELSWLSTAVGTKGQVIAVDRTPEVVADAGIRVASVIATGLQPLHFGPHLLRLESRRLREEPFRNAIRTDGPVDTNGLNPLLHPFT